MATSSNRTSCVTCNKDKITYPCQGCSQRFCFDDLAKHRTKLNEELEHIQNDHDEFRQNLIDQKSSPINHSLIQQIDQWERNSIDKIQQTAQKCRDRWINYSNQFLIGIEKQLNDIARQIKEMHQENEFNEIDLNDLKEKFENLREEFSHPRDVSIREESTSFLTKISLVLPFVKKDIRWKQSAKTIVGGNGQGDRLDQLSAPHRIFIDSKDQTIYVADCENHRIIEWRSNASYGRIVAGGNGQGNRLNQLNQPTDVIIDRDNNALIIADWGNRRVMRWPRQSNSNGQIIISGIDCSRLILHQDGSLYVSDWKKNEVRRWKKGEIKGILVAGGNV